MVEQRSAWPRFENFIRHAWQFSGIARNLPAVLMHLFLCIPSGFAAAHAQQPRVPPLQQLAPNVYAAVNQNADAAPDNRGAVANQGILIGDTGVILVDTGTSVRYGSELMARIRQLTSKPVVLAINTHQNPAFVFGNGAPELQGVPILAHRDAAELIRQRCEKCLKNLNDILGTDEMQDTRVVAPTQLIDGPTSLEAGGRRLEIVYYGQSSSPGSIGVIDTASGVLFAGGLASIDRVPDAKDARIETWLYALDALKARNLRIMVPGEGPVSPVERVDELAAYLKALQSAVTAGYKQGVALSEAGQRSELPRFRGWPLYSTAHKKNVEQQYLLLERNGLNK